jgi:hypothetical protein
MSAQRNLGSTILSLLLLASIAIGAVLVGLQLRPDAPIRFTWGEPQGRECPQGVGSPACFAFLVTNVGNRPAAVLCSVSAPDGASAAFLNRETIYESLRPIEPGVGLELTVKVDPNEDDTAPAPTLTCAEA